MGPIKEPENKKGKQSLLAKWKHRGKVPKSGIRHKIIMTTTIIMISLAIVLSIVMVGSMRILTNSVLLDTLEPMAKIASQAVESNLHILGDRILTAADNNALKNPQSTAKSRQAILKHLETGIEFVWIGLYDAEGKYIEGVNKCPSTLANEEMFTLLEQTQTLVIDDTRVRNDDLELAVGTPVVDSSGNFLYYLVGSYKYDMINDVLANINVGITGQAIIINDEGSIMAAQEKDLIREKVLLKDHFPGGEEAQELSNKMISGEIGSMPLGSGSDKLLISYAPVRGTHWSMAVYANSSDFMGIVNRSMLIGLLVVLVMVLVAAIVTSRFAGTISRPLGKVTKRIDALAQGDLQTEVEIVHSKDETETLSLALQKTVHSVNAYITELGTVLEELAKGNLNIRTETEFQGDFIAMKQSLDHISNALNEIMSEIQSSVGLLLETSKMVSDNAQMVDQSSAEQAQCVNQLSAGADTISRNIIDVSDNTQQARDLMGETEQRLTHGDELMHSLLDSMEQIKKNFDQITKINKFLEDIAFQTNILALNAAVEAARAGEAGKGFSVVADEVRALAAKTTESAQSASQIVGSSRTAVEEGSELARKTAGSMTEIADISQQVADLTLKLSSSVDEEKESLEKMLEEIRSISELADRNIEVSGQSSRASNLLERQAENLRTLAAQFRLKK